MSTSTAHRTTYRVTVDTETGHPVTAAMVRDAIREDVQRARVAAVTDFTSNQIDEAELNDRDLAVHEAARRAAAERFRVVELPWSKELEVQLLKLYDSRVHQNRAGRWTARAGSRGTYVRWAPFTIIPDDWSRPPRATGRPSTELKTLRSHLAGQVNSWREDIRELAAALVEDIDRVVATWDQPALPGVA